MASKRQPDPIQKPAKRFKKKTVKDFESDLSDDFDEELPQEEVLIPNDLEAAQSLPEELLQTLDKEPGKLLIAGMVFWEQVGRKDIPKSVTDAKMRPNLYNFNRFTDEKYRLIASGPCSAHSVVVNMDRKALTFGRNQHGQLGQAETRSYEKPTIVTGLEGFNIISAACGRNHTLFLTDLGTVYACGDNRMGQCGVGNVKKPSIMNPQRINYAGEPIIKVGCGADFSVILDIKGNLHTFGLPEYGQLGHNTDGKYFQTSTKMSFHFETTPKRIFLYTEKQDGIVTSVDYVKIVDFSCGNNHTVAIDDQKRAFSWGFGGYGRLGHAEQKDEMIPRRIKYFDRTGQGVSRVSCGVAFSLVISESGHLYYLFGKNKVSGEANMYPKPVHDLAGWKIDSLACSNTSVVISADNDLIAWGASPTYGELGLGELPKSSSIPKKIEQMDGMKVIQIAMGMSHTLLIVNTEDEKTREKYEKLNEFVIDE